MFFAAVTRSPIRAFRDGLREIQVPGAVATIATDRVLSRVSTDPDGFSIVESPVTDGGAGEAVAKLVYRRSRSTIDLRRRMRDGRALYHHINAQGELWVSTHISMLRAAGVPIAENVATLPEFFTYRCITAPRTLYKGIDQVPGGGGVSIESLGGRHVVRSLDWGRAPRALRHQPLGGVAAHAAVREVLDAAVATLAPHRDATAVLLSGGLDSSVLTRLCQIHHDRRRTYSAGFSFEDPDNNVERDYAWSASRELQTEHRYLEPTPTEYLRDLLAAIAACEKPVHHLQSVLLFALFQRGLDPRDRIVVCGEGADGIFGDEFHQSLFAEDRRYRYLRSRPLFRPLRSRPAAALLAAAVSLTGRGRHLASYLDPASPANRRLEDFGHGLWRLGLNGDVDWTRAFLGVDPRDIIASRYRAIEPLEGGSIYDVATAYSSLRVSETQAIWSGLGEASGKIVDYPFLDTRVLDSVTALPWALRLAEPKHVLREIARALGIPELIVSRPKSHFGVRHARWAAPGGVFEPLVPLAARVVDEPEIRAVQRTGHHQKAMTFWNILNYALWKRLCIAGEPLEKLLGELDEAIARGRH